MKIGASSGESPLQTIKRVARLRFDDAVDHRDVVLNRIVQMATMQIRAAFEMVKRPPVVTDIFTFFG